MKLDCSEVKSVTEVAKMIKLRYRFMLEANQDWGQAIATRRAYTEQHGYTNIRKDEELNDRYEHLCLDVKRVNVKISRLAGEISTLWAVLGVKRNAY